MTMNLVSIKNKLTNKGYVVGIKDYENHPWINGGIAKDKDSKTLILGVEIKISFDEDSFFAIDFHKQIGKKKRFYDEETLIEFICTKYPIKNILR